MANNKNNIEDRGGDGDGDGDGDGTYCPKHPNRNKLGGGICAFCLQEKLGKLVDSSSSSSFSLPVGHSHSSPGYDSSSPPSSYLSFSSSNLDPICNRNGNNRRAKIQGFLYSKKKKKKKSKKCNPPSSTSSDRAAEVARFNRSNTAPRRPGHTGGFLDGDHGDVLEYSPRKKGFWSFLYLSGGSQPLSSSSTVASSRHHNCATLSSSLSVVMPGRRAERMTPFYDGLKRCADVIPEDDDVDCRNGNNNFERKVSRSRSVGCGSRSFSGDFFERISTRFGDCTLRRVESQREPNGHGHSHSHSHSHHLSHSKPRASSADSEYCMKERIRCGGIFGGFMMASSSSSSSYWITSTSSEDHHHNVSNGVRHSSTAEDVIHGRNRSWGWTLASPMRAFSRPSSKDGKSGKSSAATPNLNAIPSLLAVGG